MMGGSESIEFMVASDAGEDWIASCAACGYAANVEKATSELAAVADGAGLPAPERFATPGVRTIEQLAGFAGGAPADRQIKTLVYLLDGTVDARAAARRPRPQRAEARRRERRARDPPRARRGDPRRARRRAGQPRRGRRREAARPRRRRAARTARHDDGREPGRLPPARRRRRPRSRGDGVARSARRRGRRGLPFVQRAAPAWRRRSRSATSSSSARATRRSSARPSSIATARPYRSSWAPTGSASAARWRPSPSAVTTRTGIDLADERRAVRGRRLGAEPERRAHERGRRSGCTRRSAGPASTCSSTIATSGPA